MLHFDGSAHDLLQAEIGREADSVSRTVNTDLVGEQIGCYRLLQVLGRGGMGTVYLAERLDGLYDKPVALKLIKRGMDTDEVVRRFQRERRILSRLEHPNIARLLDGGTTADGLPFFVMERVEGEPVTVFARNLNLDARIVLFRTVCQAVEYAHRNLVVHRDLKPGNIWVTAEGIPKLLDFGIARLLTTEEAGQTMAGWRLLTPEYASPEQKEGGPVTVASDVYSLGVVLQELLAGQKPVPELDAIVRKAREEEPHRRYASVAELSEDLQRYVDGLPVKARPNTWVYRAVKFLRRNRFYVLVSAIAVLSLISAAAISIKRAAELRHEVEQVLALATAMLFEMNDEVRQLPGSVKAREKLVQTGLRFLDDAAGKIGSDPRLEWERAQAYERIASLQGGPDELQSNLGDIDGARRSHETALRLAESLLRQRPSSRLLVAFQASQYEKLGRLAQSPGESLGHLKESLRLFTELEDTNGIEQVRLGLALAYLADGDPRTALTFLPRTTEIHSWETKVLVRKAAGDLTGAFSEARIGAELAAGVLAGARQAPQRRFAQGALARAHAYMGDILGNAFDLNLGDRSAALIELRLAARLAEENAALEPEDVIKSDLASILVRLADLLAASEPAQAVELYRRAYAAAGNIRKRDLLRRESPDVLVKALSRIAKPLFRVGKEEEAFRQLDRSLALQETAQARNTYGDLLLLNDNRAGAMAQYRLALSLAEKSVAERPWMMPWRSDLATTLEKLARTLEDAGDHRAAVEYWKRSYQLWREWGLFGSVGTFNQKREMAAAAALARLSGRLPPKLY